jgi:PD-(D/E)XK endonuclease
VVMGVLIGDLMASADERFGPGGSGRKGGKRGEGRGRYAKGSGDGGPSDRKERGPQDDNGLKQRGPQDDKSFIEEPTSAASLRTQGKIPPKRMGELSELDFLRKAMGMGMIVSKPWGDSYRYDFVCDTNGKLWRTQVRSTEDRFGARGYAVHASVYVGHKIVGLTKKDIDVLIGYIVSRDIWYVVPVEAFVPRKNLWFYPDGSKKGAMFEKWREAWWVMMGRKWRAKP